MWSMSTHTSSDKITFSATSNERMQSSCTKNNEWLVDALRQYREAINTYQGDLEWYILIFYSY